MRAVDLYGSVKTLFTRYLLWVSKASVLLGFATKSKGIKGDGLLPEMIARWTYYTTG